MNPSDQHASELAHLIWESEGRPEGQAKRHWKMACRLAAAEAKASEVFTPPRRLGETTRRDQA